MQPENYESYITGPDWAKRKKAWFSNYGKWCRICKTDINIHLHHKSYDRFTCEEDDDLVALCEEHHTIVHKYHKEKKNISLRDATDIVISISELKPIKLGPILEKRLAKKIEFQKLKDKQIAKVKQREADNKKFK